MKNKKQNFTNAKDEKINGKNISNMDNPINPKFVPPPPIIKRGKKKP